MLLYRRRVQSITQTEKSPLHVATTKAWCQASSARRQQMQDTNRSVFAPQNGLEMMEQFGNGYTMGTYNPSFL